MSSFSNINIRCHRSCLSSILVASKCKQYFSSDLEVLKGFYCTPCSCGITIDGKLAPMMLVILSTWDLDAQQGFFKLPMKSSVA
jgi:hypothetical protein